MRILVVDDHPLFLAGIRQALIDRTDQPDSVVEAGSITAALAAIEAEQDFDWILLDLQLPDGDGFSLLNELTSRRLPIPVIILSARSDPATVDRALRSGASGYLPKSAPISEIIEAMRALERSGHYVARSLRSNLDAYRAGIIDGGAAELTRRQQQILELVARGLGNLEIAETLGLSLSTVKGHVATLFSLLDADNRTACVHEARRMRLID